MEQEILTGHKLKVVNLIRQFGKIVEIPVPVGKKENKEKIILRKLIDRVEKSYGTIKPEVDNDGPGVDVYKLQGYEERVKRYEAHVAP